MEYRWCFLGKIEFMCQLYKLLTLSFRFREPGGKELVDKEQLAPAEFRKDESDVVQKGKVL